MRRTSVVKGLSFALATASFLAVNQAQAQIGHFNYSTGTGDAKDWVSYGNSIMAGFCGIFCGQLISYSTYYADDAAADNDWAITLSGYAHSGETTIQIYDEMLNTHHTELVKRVVPTPVNISPRTTP